MLSNNFKGHLAAIFTNLIFGFNMTVTKALFSSSWLTPLGLSMTRMIFGVIIFWTFSFLVPREKIRLRDLPILAAAGILGMTVTQLAFFSGLRYMTPVIASLIAALGPFFVLLLSAIFLSDPISKKKTIGVIIGISGAVLVVLQNINSGSLLINFWGIGLFMISTVSYSIYIIIMRKISARYSPITLMKWLFLWAAIFLLPLGLPELSKQRLYSHEIALLPIVQLSFSLLFSGMIGVILMPIALKRIKATTVSMYTNLQPLAASTAAIVIGQDVFTWDKPLALLLIVTGVFIVTQGQAPENRLMKKKQILLP